MFMQINIPLFVTFCINSTSVASLMIFMYIKNESELIIAKIRDFLSIIVLPSIKAILNNITWIISMQPMWYSFDEMFGKNT